MRLPRVLLDGHQHSGEGPSEAGSVLAPASSPPSTFLHPSSPFFNPSHIIHTSQGFRAFPWTGISILVKDHLKLGPAAAQLMTSTAYMPWSVKPLYGIVSDCVPIRGGRRIPYIIIANALSLLSWLALAFVPSLAASAAPFTLLLVLQNVGAAMADVVIDAMVAEAAKGDKERYAGDLQSLSWFSMAAGGVVGSLLGGPALKTLQPHGISHGNRMSGGSESEESGELGEWEKVVPEQVVPEQQEEESVEGKGKEMGSDLFEPSRGKADEKSVEAVGARKKDGEGKEGDEVGGGKEEGGGEKSVAGEQSTGLRQRRGREGGDGEGGKGNAAETGRAEGAEEARKRRSEERSRRKAAGGLGRKVLDLVTALWHAVMSPDIFWPMAWFMTSCAVVPTLTSSLFYFHTNHLHLDPSFLGSTKVIGWAGLMLGTLLYNTRLKYVPIRRIFMWVHISMAVCTIADTLLTSRLNLRLGIPDTVFLLGSAAVSDAVNQFKFMPFLVLSARLCPPGIEGTLFALFMSAYNFGNTLSGYMGATLATRLGITATSFDNLTLGVTIQAVCTLLPILFLRCVPANMTGVGDEGKQAVRVVEEQREDEVSRKHTWSKRPKKHE
ncbi:unnamed protein product [Closterium sp. NIES-65]|nr:unnamed protein product [Closterium sp. NIES-65]